MFGKSSGVWLELTTQIIFAEVSAKEFVLTELLIPKFMDEFQMPSFKIKMVIHNLEQECSFN